MPALRLLTVEDSARDARVLRELLREGDPDIMLDEVRTLSAGRDALASSHYDCVLLDLGLPDGDGLSNVRSIRAAGRDVAIVVLTGRDDDAIALQSLRGGAQEYAVKGEHDGVALLRIVQHAIERQRVLAQVDSEREQHYIRASHDSLTGLPNRQLLLDRARQALCQAERIASRLGVLFLDLDGFKAVNDAHGHPVGDALLLEVAERLRQVLRDGDTVARVGGDEFIVLLHAVRDPAEAEAIANRVIASISSIRSAEGRAISIGCSAGLALFPEHGPGMNELMAQADASMYEAKAAGKGVLRIASARASRDRGAASASVLDDATLDVAFHPWIDAHSGHCGGVEALLRSARGADAPSLLSAAEQAGAMGTLGAWVLRRACRDWMRSGARRHPRAHLAVNVSGAELDAPDFAESRFRILHQCGMAPSSLLIEVAESALEHRNVDARVVQLRELRAGGAGVALDHFGRDMGSLRRLHDLPVTTVKIDSWPLHQLRSGSGRAGAILQAILHLADALGVDAIVTGVETEADVERARDAGARWLQGWWTGRPMHARALDNWLATCGRVTA